MFLYREPEEVKADEGGAEEAAEPYDYGATFMAPQGKETAVDQWAQAGTGDAGEGLRERGGEEAFATAGLVTNTLHYVKCVSLLCCFE